MPDSFAYPMSSLSRLSLRWLSAICSHKASLVHAPRKSTCLLLAVVLVSGYAFATDSTPGGGSSPVSSSGATPVAPANNTVAGINAVYD